MAAVKNSKVEVHVPRGGSSGIQVGLEIRDLEYSVRDGTSGKGLKPILRGISGTVLPGEMLCVLGPSGGGKTSLIQAICGRIRDDGGRRASLTGTMRCNGVELSPSQFRRISGLVTQEDVLNAAIRVRETLDFAARLRLPRDLRKQRVDWAIQLLQLEKCASTFVGDESLPGLKGISGGEKRRLAIAMEILDPNISILLLDEPTSGLDAASALNVANLLRSLADAGITVVTSIHQPRPSILAVFHKLMVLAEGRTTYFGPPARLVAYFEQEIGCPLPGHEVPTDWLLDALNPVIREAKEGGSEGGLAAALRGEDVAEGLASQYAKSSLARAMQDEGSKLPKGGALQEQLARRAGGRVSWCQQFWVLLHRTSLVKLREPISLATQLSQAIFMGLLFGMLYYNSYEKEMTLAILDVQMAVAMVGVMVAWTPFDVLLTFPRERRIYLREKGAGLYSTSSFFCARILADMPFMLVSALALSLITWPTIGFRMSLGYFILLNCAGILVGAAVLQMVGALSANFEQANMLSMVVLMLAMMLSPAFVRKPPAFLDWAADVSFIGVLSQMTMYLEFQDVGELFNGALSADDVYEMYSIRIRSDDDLWWGVCLLLATWVLARVVGFLGVKFLHTGRTFAEILADG